MTNVSEIMTKDVNVCAPHDSVETAAKMMRDIDCGSIPVCEGKKVVGMITDRDIIINCVADGKDTHDTHCHDCMTTDVITCDPTTDVHECARLMADNQVRRIPVVENGEIVGICAIGDLVKMDIYVNEAGDALNHISEQNHFNH
ncbi:CBS domain-containing protein [Cytobacillus horneckiae]|uniref:CBS domain-containing protein n=1 Tax=Cytobacillus horneckiae TaxID=549687 RepID=A0A2N0ZL15_9BACI|nr:CBS domain-containing protein [Cytobacillus horneckiae]NRG48267.1 CBS domain-containing protein [Bacillus sp. CRN 9]MBN6885611.1 CBS domain-containing protein [Cytobacillus horneckiae]MCM3180472.1 CBS domain-containing protein [Cytobacillus horneckiae]MEC1156278.1 CBS domain-containing protein [Cytobacillus horneckiae]MED2938296.1 CBS domain-containing protein [Cytobacillus horneckiae]